ncbi:MAG: rod shape-determining protein MreC [Paludibacteraceae bacterium]|nr:rod shape-determining protein MreC [Paludibacteraceae bacterium]
MASIIRFFVKHRIFILFLFLECLSLFFVVKHNQFQRTAFVNSSNVVVGNIYAMSNSVSEYFGLGKVNQALAAENAELKQRLCKLEEDLRFLKQDSSYQGRKDMALQMKYTFVTAKVINASTNKHRNYLTLNKGTDEGIREDMGVVNEKGVVGIVSATNSYFSVVLPIINPDAKINVKLKGERGSGPLVWKGPDCKTAILEEMPRYVKAAVGDTVVTSGYSSIFPEGLNVGRVKYLKQKNDDNYYIEVELFADFSQLSYVDAIAFDKLDEQLKLEAEKAEGGKK